MIRPCYLYWLIPDICYEVYERGNSCKTNYNSVASKFYHRISE